MRNSTIIATTILITIIAVLAYFIEGAPFSTWTQAEGTIVLFIGYIVAYLLWDKDE